METVVFHTRKGDVNTYSFIWQVIAKSGLFNNGMLIKTYIFKLDQKKYERMKNNFLITRFVEKWTIVAFSGNLTASTNFMPKLS